MCIVCVRERVHRFIVELLSGCRKNWCMDRLANVWHVHCFLFFLKNNSMVVEMR